MSKLLRSNYTVMRFLNVLDVGAVVSGHCSFICYVMPFTEFLKYIFQSWVLRLWQVSQPTAGQKGQ